MPLTGAHRPLPRVTLAVAVALSCVAWALAGTPESRAGGDADRPNVIIILTDDQRNDDMWVMNGTRRRLGGSGAGVSFVNNFATYPLCCPSRATLLTGQYAHNHGVFDNGGPDGGIANFDDTPTLATQLHAAGYRTGYYGKYLNGYPGRARNDPEGSIPPGWDRWFGLIDAGQYDWSAAANGSIRRFGREPRDYQTDVLARLSREFVRKHAGRRKPFFLTVATNAPHGEKGRRFSNRNPRPAKRHLGVFEDAKLPKPPSFNEDDVSDKPPFLQVEKLPKDERLELRDRYRGRLESLLAVDELVVDLVRELRRENELRETYVLFTSDNGFLLGEHRLEKKRLLYEESARVPLLMRGPGVPKGVVRPELSGNIDIAPTIYDGTGVSPPDERRPDGISLLDVIDDPDAYSDRDLLLENRHLGSADGVGAALRTPSAVLIEQRVNGELNGEFYALNQDPEAAFYDPYQLENQYENPLFAGVIAQMQARLDELRDCAGNGCR